ncbi:uncharacterized protein C1orf159 homolog isoform X2 [Perca fluviatilis]|uniref:uncharacterized protein C1orf159 homolog isoform X2 n=1 Tax=Perca fluviatilis TaxID=8168 RepID=UPI00196667BF|nr:uncharacterized protein C1orf159 homolog isoform X2 [Perca fluviatilis]
MALSFLLVLAATVILIRPETPVTKALHQNSLECCGDKQRVNNSCSNDTHCEPGCFLRVLDNSNTVCIFCDSAAVDLENITVCTYNYTMERKNHTTVTTVIPKIALSGSVMFLSRRARCGSLASSGNTVDQPVPDPLRGLLFLPQTLQPTPGHLLPPRQGLHVPTK